MKKKVTKQTLTWTLKETSVFQIRFYFKTTLKLHYKTKNNSVPRNQVLDSKDTPSMQKQ